ncbi:MAG: exopolysaccharide production protein, partial [Salinibacterium sp.]|nr:exopolysaccharide production protein [Salinibacterium sp.]
MTSPGSSSAGSPAGRGAVRETIVAILSSPELARVLAIASIGTAVLAFALQRVIGLAGLLGILAVLGVLAIAAFIARRDMVDWQGILPVSLLAFLGWAAISIAWSQYQWATLGSLIYFGTFTVLGVVVALSRDTIQIVRSYGDVLRVVLAASIVLEIFAGVLIDAPIGFIGVDGNLNQFGPVQGLMGTRNEFGLLALIGAVTFGTELRTRSVQT